MQIPTVSVIMNCYNNEKFLREALDSAILQSFSDWELIFWDDQSTDKSPEIFKSYNDPRFKYHRSQKRTKLGEARNLAVAQASGTWLAFLDCDDEWKPNKLEKQLDQAGQQLDMIGIVYNPIEIKINSNNKRQASLKRIYDRLIITPHSARSIYIDLLLMGNNIIFSALLIRRDLYLKVGGVNDKFSQNEDYELLLKASRISNAVCIEDVCTVYRIHDSNASHVQAELNYKENIAIYNNLPFDTVVARALKLNASRYAIYKISKGQIFNGIKMLLMDGDPIWFIKRGCKRFAENVFRS